MTALAPFPAHADSTKSKKAKAPPKKKKNKDEVVIPAAPAAASTKALEEKLKKEDEEQEPTRLAPAALPERGGELTKDDKADKRRDEAIEQIKKILPKMKNPHDVADLKFQLADLWWQKSRYVKFNQEMPAYQDAAEKWHKCRETKGDKACGAEPRPNHRKSELFRANAVDLYQRIIKEHPQYDRVDEIRFDLAYDKMDIASATENKVQKEKLQKEAIDAYKSLIAFNPKSDYVTDALIEMGNYYFDHNDLERASKAFGDAFGKHNKRTETYALYKLAWCRYNQGDYADSVKKLKEVVDRSERQDKDQKLKLKTEALRDLILAFTKNGERESAIKYYILKAGKEGSKDYIVRLANEFFTAGGAQYDDAIKTYQYLLNDRPLDPYAPEWQSKIVLAYDKKSNRAKVREEIKVLVRKYGKASDWYKTQKEGPRQRAVDLTEEALYNLVTDYHQEAIKTKSVATYTLARDIYREYIDNFPDSERAYQMRFYYSEILYALEDYQEAYNQYRKVAEDNSQKQLKTTAAKDMLLAAEKLVDIDDGLYTKQVTNDSTIIDEGKKKDDIKEQKIHEKIDREAKEVKLTQHEQQLVESCDYYTKLVPDADDEARVRLRAAVIYFDKHQYVAAADRFGYIIQKWPEDQTSRSAAQLILEALETKQEWETLNKRAREFAQNKKLLEGEKKQKGGDFKQKLQVYIEGSTFKIAMKLQNDDTKAADAAIEFAGFVKEFPKSKYSPIAGYNAFLDYQKSKQLEKAIEIGEKIIKEFPNADSNDMRSLPGADAGQLRPVILPDLTFRLAKTYELTADFERAATEYEKYVKAYPAEDSAPDAQFNAALWYRGLGEDQKAIDAFTKYIKVYQSKKPDERTKLKLVSDAAVQWTICQIYESEKAWDKFTKCTEKDYLGNYHNVRGLKEPYWQVMNAKYREFLAYGEQDNKAKQNEMVKYIEDLYKVYLNNDDKQRDTTKLAMAHTQFFKLEPEFDHFKEMKFRSAVPWRLANTMKEDLAAIKAALKALEAKYTEIVKYGNGDWAIAALVRIGMGPRIFANALRGAPVPSNLDADQKEMYKGDLEDKAIQIETPAVDLLLTAIKKSFELGIYNEWTLKAEAALAEFKPELVGPTRELPLKGSTFFFTADNEAPRDSPAKTATTQPATDQTKAAGSGGDR